MCVCVCVYVCVCLCGGTRLSGDRRRTSIVIRHRKVRGLDDDPRREAHGCAKILCTLAFVLFTVFGSQTSNRQRLRVLTTIVIMRLLTYPQRGLHSGVRRSLANSVVGAITAGVLEVMSARHNVSLHRVIVPRGGHGSRYMPRKPRGPNTSPGREAEKEPGCLFFRGWQYNFPGFGLPGDCLEVRRWQRSSEALGSGRTPVAEFLRTLRLGQG